MSEEVFSELMTTSEIVPDYWRLGQGDFADCILDSEGDWLIVFKACDIGHAKALMWIVGQWQQSQQEKQAVYEAGRAAGKAEERKRIVGRLNNLITRYIKSPGIEFSDTLTAKVALEDAIAIAREEG